jgi:hypothetical protein
MQQFVDQSGKPLNSGLVYFYVPGTTTPSPTWVDPYMTTLNSNPIILDAAGRAIIWGNGLYREVLIDQFGNTIWDQLTFVAPPIGSNATGTGLQVLQNSPTIVSPALTGVPTTPTATIGTNTTQIASTAFVAAAVEAPEMILIAPPAPVVVPTPPTPTIAPPVPAVAAAAPPVRLTWPPLPVAPAPDAPPVTDVAPPAPVPCPAPPTRDAAPQAWTGDPAAAKRELEAQYKQIAQPSATTGIRGVFRFALEAAGVTVTKSPASMGVEMRRLFQQRGLL